MSGVLSRAPPACPECGEAMTDTEWPGDASVGEWGGPVMALPCECVVFPVWEWGSLVSP